MLAQRMLQLHFQCLHLQLYCSTCRNRIEYPYLSLYGYKAKFGSGRYKQSSLISANLNINLTMLKVQLFSSMHTSSLHVALKLKVG